MDWYRVLIIYEDFLHIDSHLLTKKHALICIVLDIESDIGVDIDARAKELGERGPEDWARRSTRGTTRPTISQPKPLAHRIKLSKNIRQRLLGEKT